MLHRKEATDDDLEFHIAKILSNSNPRYYLLLSLLHFISYLKCKAHLTHHTHVYRHVADMCVICQKMSVTKW